MKEYPLFAGIDVSKDRLDVAVRPTGEAWRSPTILAGSETWWNVWWRWGPNW